MIRLPVGVAGTEDVWSGYTRADLRIGAGELLRVQNVSLDSFEPLTFVARERSRNGKDGLLSRLDLSWFLSHT